MADSQVKTANICNITSSTTLSPNVGGSGTYISDNNISVYMSGTVAWSGIYCQYTNVDAVVNDYYTISFTPICATNSTLQIEVAGTAKKTTFTSGTRTSVTIQASSTSRYVAFYGGDTVEKTVIIRDIQIEKGETATPYRPYSATGWLHSLRKLTTATEAAESPLYSDGTAITAYTLKGNTVQNGTPTPSNPVDVNGVGVRTENKFDKNATNTSNGYADNYRLNSGVPDVAVGNFITEYIEVEPSETYTISGFTAGWSSSVSWYDSNYTLIGYKLYENRSATSFTVPSNAKYIRFTGDMSKKDITMLNTGSTAKPFEPYGYKIPISSGDVTTDIYLGSTQTTRQIKKLVLTGDEDWRNSTSDNTKFFIFTISPDYLRAASQITYICTHYIPYQQTTDALLVPNGRMSMSSATAQRLYIADDNYTTVEDFKTYLQQQYAAGTPVTVWYVLATAETAAVNEPLMKIGTYADSISNAVSIPTTEGANSITVDTTVQPSEFTATWTGWHDASVKEWDGSQWNE